MSDRCPRGTLRRIAKAHLFFTEQRTQTQTNKNTLRLFHHNHQSPCHPPNKQSSFLPITYISFRAPSRASSLATSQWIVMVGSSKNTSTT